MTKTFRTIIPIPSYPFTINHQSPILMLGSCFVEHMGDKLHRYQFPIQRNPFGIIYNPASLAQCITRLSQHQPYTINDLQKHKELYFSFDHHSHFSHTNPQICLERSNTALEKAHHFLKEVKLVVITLGTAWVYAHKEEGRVVANCHKIPARQFHKYRLSLADCQHYLNQIREEIKALQEDCQFLFTVSPVRHWKDGAIANQTSKSTLLLAVADLVDEYSDCHYFPAYEIMMDELRDYRFYDKDLLHPNEQAIDYIWQQFQEAIIDSNSQALIPRIEKIKTAFAHRPLHPETIAFRQFCQASLKQIRELERAFDFLEFGEERGYFEHNI